MKVKILDELIPSFSEIKNKGIPSKGSMDKISKFRSGPLLAQFPAERASGIDNAYNSSSLYTNGMLFTAYHFEQGAKESLRSLRTGVQNSSRVDTLNATQANDASLLCKILLPRSITDVENNSHRYQDATDSVVAKGISRVASNMVWGMLDSATGGIMADYRAALDVGTKAAFQGSDKRIKSYINTFVIESRSDLVEFSKIYFLFTALGYGTTGSPAKFKDAIGMVKDLYESAVQTVASSIGADSTPIATGDTFGSAIVDFLTNVEVISAPPVWFIRDFTVNTAKGLPHSTFGPAGITSARFNRTLDSIVNTLREYPNVPIAVEMEIQFMELIDMRQDSIFDTANVKNIWSFMK